MKILMVGGGAREHAIAAALARSPNKPELFAYMPAANPGIKRLAKEYAVGDICKPDQVAAYAQKCGANLAVIGPEAPLAAGVVDVLEKKGIQCVGPRRIPAQLESDKAFSRALMRRHRLEGTPFFELFESAEDACGFIDEYDGDLVVKPAGLTGGKGVQIMGEHFDSEGAKKYIKEIFATKMGVIPKIVLEERLIGEEFTIQAFVDGQRVQGTPMVQDHKRAYDGDIGPNTGGMGSYNDRGYILPFLTQKDYDDAIRIMEATVKAVKKETGEKYKGFLYGQFMATREGVKVIEYNARLGDPEAMNILSILESDMLQICENIAAGRLGDQIKFKDKATVCKYFVPEGYPDSPLNNVEVEVDEKAIEEKGGRIYYASVREENGKILTSKSRAIAVVGIADTITEAEQAAASCMPYVKGKLFFRKDIGTEALIEKRIRLMKQLRG
ncbi:MAG: phosphoribosylamine--glycine ligase [Candidatus Altiarchaeota archaeon]